VILQKAKLRAVIEACRETAQAAYSCDVVEAEEVRSKGEFRLAEIHDRSGAGKQRSAADALTEAFGLVEAAHTHGCAGLSTGIDIVDRLLGGLLPTGLYYFSGAKGTGKTTLVRNIAEYIAGTQGIPVGFFSLEQSDTLIWLAVAARRAGVSLFSLLHGYPIRNPSALINARAEVQNWPLHVIDAPQTPETLRSSCRRLVAKHGCKLICLDYLQKLKTPKGERLNGIEERMSYFSDQILQLAKELNIPFIVISALSRGKDGRPGQLRGSEMIDYDAWAHIKLVKADEWEPDRQIMDLHLEKQRFGPPVDAEQLMLTGNGEFVPVLSPLDEAEERAIYGTDAMGDER